jgi:hypothetical protein
MTAGAMPCAVVSSPDSLSTRVLGAFCLHLSYPIHLGPEAQSIVKGKMGPGAVNTEQRLQVYQGRSAPYGPGFAGPKYGAATKAVKHNSAPIPDTVLRLEENDRSVAVP